MYIIMLAFVIPAMLVLRQIGRRGAEIAYTNRHAAYYAIFSILFFWFLYQLLGMKKHFDIPEYLGGREKSWLTSLYTSVLAQSNAMPDTTPKSNVARIFFMIQVSLGWFWFLLFS